MSKRRNLDNVIRLAERLDTKGAGRKGKAEAAPSAVDVARNMRKARQLAAKGKSAKTIAKQTGLTPEEVKAIIRAEQGIANRRSHRETLQDMLKRFESLIPIAEAAYEETPSGYNASAISTLSGEIRGLMGHLDDLAKPEHTALELIQNGIQPFVQELLREFTVELRKARAACLAVAPGIAEENEVRRTFDELTRTVGKVASDRYSTLAEKVGILMQCDLEELRKLGRDSKAEHAALLEAEKKAARGSIPDDVSEDDDDGVPG